MLKKIQEAYGLQDIKVNLFEYKGADLSASDVKVHGFMQKNPYKEKEYSIFYCEGADIKELIIHEMAHICQYEEGLMTLVNGIELWKGRDVMGWKNYWHRPHEKDARRRVRKFKRKNKWLRKL